MEFINAPINSIINAILNVLPRSPFATFIQDLQNSEFAQNMRYVNWFVPFKDFLAILGGWISVIALFYLYSVIMRWVKLIGD